MEQKKLLSDDQLIMLIKDNDSQAMQVIIERYKSMVRKISHAYFLSGGDSEDLSQEGMIGLVNAVNSYSISGKATFKSYAYTCIKNSIIAAVRSSSCMKHIPLNNYISLSGLEGQDKDKKNISINNTSDPEASIINSEAASELKLKIKGCLSKLEYSILTYFLDGYSYSEIAIKLNKSVKSIDNALQRIRRKVNSALN